MKTPDTPINEAARLEALRGFRILDTLPETVYDDIVHLAAHICGTPIALVSLVDEDRQWFKARVGLDAEQTPRDVSFCGHAVALGASLEVEDARVDPRFADNPLVTGAPHIRFYAGAPLVTAEGHPLGTLCVIDREPRGLTPAQRDALERLGRQVIHHLERRLVEIQEAEAQREAATVRAIADRFFDLSPDMLCLAGPDGYFTALNPAWERTLGWSNEELMSRPFLEFVHPDDQESTQREAARLNEGGHVTVHFENRYMAKGGGWRWLRWGASLDEEARRIVAVARDVTGLKEDEQRLIEAVRSAERANKAKSSFLANMSHELRTPLNSVIGFANVLLKNKPGNLQERQTTYLERVRDNGKHLLTLINDILDLSKVEAGHVELEVTAVDLRALCEEVLATLDTLAQEADSPLRLVAPDVLEPIAADAKRVKQVLINLVGNALKFGAGAPVEIRIVVDPRVPTRALRVDVADAGIGIPPDKWERVFDAFRQADESTSRRFGGTGLGLPLSRALCREMGFELRLDSEEGRGATFALLLSPAAPDPRHVPPVDLRVEASGASTPAARERRAGRDVLVVDDDPEARELLAVQLEELGCSYRLARSGREGLRMAAAEAPDLITLDIMMPDMDGWAVLAALRADARTSDIPVIIVSASLASRSPSQAGDVEVLFKPVGAGALGQSLVRYLSDARRVLVVDDDPDARLLAERGLSELGYSVAVAADGLEALQALDDVRPDVIVLDLTMPVMDGFRFLELLRRSEHKAVPVVVCSARDISERERRLLERAAQGSLDKGDLSTDALGAVLAQVLL